MRRTAEGQGELSSRAPRSRRARRFGVVALCLLVCVSCGGGARHATPAISTPDLFPVRHDHAVITSGFGVRGASGGSGHHHNGVDIAAPKGAPVIAAADGRVTHAAKYSSYGRLVVIDHGNDYQTWYAHLSKIRVKKGQRLRAGQLLGDVGKSGRATAPHLHYEVRQNGQPTDPGGFPPKAR